MSPTVYMYIFYGSLLVMPPILLLIFFALDGCRVWGKRTAKELIKLNYELHYGQVNRVMTKAADSLSDFNERTSNDLKRIQEYEIERHVRETIQKPLPSRLNVDEADVCFAPDYEDLSNGESKEFDASKFIMDFHTRENKSTSFQELEDAVNACKPAEAITNSEVKEYADEYIIRPSESFNERGIRRLAVSAHHLDVLKSLGYSIATEYTKPLSPSAVLFNIIEAHLQSYRKEVNDLVEMGERNKSIYL